MLWQKVLAISNINFILLREKKILIIIVGNNDNSVSFTMKLQNEKQPFNLFTELFMKSSRPSD